MELLGNLVGKTQAANGRSHWNSQFRKLLNMRINQVNRVRFSGSEIHLDCLPRARSMLNGDFDTDGVRLFHVESPGFDSKCELIES